MKDKPFVITDDLLWDYADGLLRKEDVTKLEAFLAEHPEWVKRLEAIRSDRKLMQEMPMETPPAGFVGQVMSAIKAEQDPQTEKGDWVIKGIGIAFSLFILLPLVLLIGSSLKSDASLGIAIPEFATVDLISLLTHPYFQYGMYLIFTLLALRLLDAVLSQYRNMNNTMGLS